jgi:hypothetical protein
VKIDETNRRTDELYGLLGRIYEAPVKGAAAQKQ